MADANNPKNEMVRTTLTPQIKPCQPAPALSLSREAGAADIKGWPDSSAKVLETETKHLIDCPASGRRTAPATATLPPPRPETKIQKISVSLCWMLLGVSVAILILQIWNYLS